MAKISGKSKSRFKFRAETSSLISQILNLAFDERTVRSPGELSALEEEVDGVLSSLHALLVGRMVQQSVDSETFLQDANLLLKAWPCKLRNEGFETVMVCTLRGAWIPLRIPYYRQRSRGDSPSGRRKKRKAGLYPALVLLGIHDRRTPATVSLIASTAVLLGSFQEAAEVLSHGGIKISANTVRQLTYRFEARAKALLRSGSITFPYDVKGRRVVISVDGGRYRRRKNKRGRKTKKGRHRYSTDWKEPKLLIIYVVDEEGTTDRTIAPFIDGTMNGPDAVFGLIEYYLQHLEIQKADSILFVADGARWIWGRVPALFATLGLDEARSLSLIDFYHAAEHLGRVAALRASWTAKERKRWMHKQRRLLLSGDVAKVIENIQSLRRGPASKKIGTELRYFIRNQSRMKYAQLAEMKMPIGSGAIESAIRRVINLRIKGPGVFWKPENAQAVLTVRAFYKAGQWEMLRKAAETNIYMAAA